KRFLGTHQGFPFVKREADEQWESTGGRQGVWQTICSFIALRIRAGVDQPRREVSERSRIHFSSQHTRLIFRTLTGVTNVGSGSSFSLEPLVGKSCRSSGAEMPFLRHCRHRPDRSRLPLIGTSIGFS